ncbi:MAG: hypothetical protein K0R93_1567 [Anaerosolibacter sp.]|nr:hypothetical protein [Anaerosolibacter sp.]
MGIPMGKFINLVYQDFHSICNFSIGCSKNMEEIDHVDHDAKINQEEQTAHDRETVTKHIHRINPFLYLS